jgi:methionine sulfoxide reductase heme-binding subunit
MPEALVRAVAAHPYRFAALSLVACAVAALVGYGSGIDGLQAVTRYTGRAGLFWFAVVFVMAGSHRFSGDDDTGRALTITRGFALHHTVHLGLLLTYLRASGHDIQLSRAAGGMLGYVLLYATVATSTAAAADRIGISRWRAFHQAGLWYLWIVFVLTYLPRILGKLPGAGGGPIEFLACMTLLMLIAATRLGALAKAKICTHPSAPSR